jgi:hypothetical protein
MDYPSRLDVKLLHMTLKREQIGLRGARIYATARAIRSNCSF